MCHSSQHYSLMSAYVDNKLSVVVLTVVVSVFVFPAQANDGVAVDQTQSFYVGGK